MAKRDEFERAQARGLKRKANEPNGEEAGGAADGGETAPKKAKLESDAAGSA